MTQPLNIAQATPARPENPYYWLLPEALARSGDNLFFADTLKALHETAGRVDLDIVHFHQLEPYYRHPAYVRGAARALRLALQLRSLGRRVPRLVYTLHDPAPVDGLHPSLDRHLNTAMAGLADAVIVLGEVPRLAAEASGVPPEKLRVLPHPHYGGAYGPPVERAVARERLGLPLDRFVFLSLGRLGPYKGHDAIIAASEELRVADAMTLIVGGETDRRYHDHLRSLAQGTRSVELVPRALSEEDLPLWLSAADAAVFAFRRLFMSGSLMLALTYGLPVIAPSVGAIPEYVVEGEGGTLYEQDNIASLVAAMRRIHHDPPDRAAVKASVAHLSPDLVAGRLRAIYTGSDGGR